LSVGSASAAVTCGIASGGLSTGQYSCFVGSEDGDELKAFAVGANKDVSTFFYSVGANNSDHDVKVSTTGNVDTDNGYGEIKPIKNGTLTDIVLTPTATASNQYDGMFWRGQFENNKSGNFDGNVFADVTSAAGVTQFEFSGLTTSNDQDHLVIGFDEPKGSIGARILSVEIFVQSGDMKSFKQVDFSQFSSSVPEPSTWGMVLLGFAGLGYAGYRKTKSPAALFA
jgi:hypothetical protein